MQKGFYHNLLNIQNIKNVLSKLSILSDDISYIEAFAKTTGIKIYEKHISTGFISCLFCQNLFRTGFHEFCLSCSKQNHTNCSCLLPGIYSYGDGCFQNADCRVIPWLFKKTCTHFKRIDRDNYFRNFMSPNHAITAENFEALEGLFTGLIDSKRPCHICASVNLRIFYDCCNSGMNTCSKRCNSIYKNILNEYGITISTSRYSNQ